MIFGKDYDLALSIVLKCEKKYIEELINLLDELPKELVNQIHIATSLIENKGEYSKLTTEEQKMMNGLVECMDGICFSFDIDVYDESLCISKKKKHDILNVYNPLYELTLKRYSYDDYYDLEFFEDEDVASIERDIDVGDINISSDSIVSMISCEEIEYNIRKTPFGWFIFSCIDDKNDRVITKVSRINLKKILSLQEQLGYNNYKKMFMPKVRKRKIK